MGKVLLISTLVPSPGEQYSKFRPPFGLLTIAAALQEGNYDVELIDPMLEENYMDKIAEAAKQDLIYIGMPTFMGSNILHAREFSIFLKKIAPHIPIVWGGPLASQNTELCLTDAPIDYVIMGMGEETSVKLAEALENRVGNEDIDIPHVSTRINGKIVIKETFYNKRDLDSFPYAALPLWSEGITRSGSIPLLTTRGCPRKCGYCHQTFTGKKRWFGRGIESILDEMEHWKKHYNMNDFNIIDDNWLVNTARAVEFLKACIERKYIIRGVIGHLADYKDEICDLIYGYIDDVQFSIETVAPRIQKLVNKPIDPERVLDLFDRFTKNGVKEINTNFMFGFPSETDDDVRTNILFAAKIRALNPDIKMTAFVFTPQPDDHIMPQFPEYQKKIKFTLDNLSCDFVPNRSKHIAIELRPWMTEEDVQFHLDVVVAFMYHFSPVVRHTQEIDIMDMYAKSPRLAKVFEGIEIPQDGLQLAGV